MRFLPALILAVALLVADFWLLWKPRSDQISGDVLIHLIFSRSFGNGQPFAFADGQISRANTSIVWELILAAVGKITGTLNSGEGFVFTVRLVSLVVLGLTGWRLYVLNAKLKLSDRQNALVLAFALFNPITFYWTIANPMETALGLLFTTLFTEWILFADQTADKRQIPVGIIGGFLSFALFSARPEMLLISGLGVVILLLPTPWQKWKLALGWLSGVAIPLLILAAKLHSAGLAFLPNAGDARRLSMMKQNAINAPWLNLPYSPDSWLFALLLGPLIVGSVWLYWDAPGPRKKIGIYALAALGFATLFFSFYYYTTWQGRYFLPILMILLPAGLAGCSSFSEKGITPLFVIYALCFSAVVMRPLAGYANARQARNIPKPHYIEPSPGDKTILCNEVQGAYYHPHLWYISSEGLISLEALKAYRQNKTVREFIRELRPNLIGICHFYLRDPEDLEYQINHAAAARSDLHLPGIRLLYLGEMAGTGPIFRATYD